MRGSAQPDDGPGPVQVSHEMFHLVSGPVLEPREDDHEVRVVQLLNTGHVIGSWLDLTLGIEAENHGALKAMVLGQDAREGRQGFLGSIFVVTGDEDEVLALAGATFPLIDKGSRRVEQRG